MGLSSLLSLFSCSITLWYHSWGTQGAIAGTGLQAQLTASGLSPKKWGKINVLHVTGTRLKGRRAWKENAEKWNQCLEDEEHLEAQETGFSAQFSQ